MTVDVAPGCCLRLPAGDRLLPGVRRRYYAVNVGLERILQDVQSGLMRVRSCFRVLWAVFAFGEGEILPALLKMKS